MSEISVDTQGLVETGATVIRGLDTLADRALVLCRQFYDLDYEQRMATSCDRTMSYRGYAQGGQDSLTVLGTEVIKPRMYSSFDVGMWRHGRSELERFLYSRNVWPEDSSRFQRSVLRLRDSLYLTAKTVARQVCLDLGIENSAFTADDRANNLYGSMRFLRYTNKPSTFSKSHTDFEFITLVISDAPGLEVQDKRGKWRELPFKHGDITVLAGNCAEDFSGGLVKSAGHRVSCGPRTRLAVPFFLGPDIDDHLSVPDCTFGHHLAGRIIRSTPHLLKANLEGLLLSDLPISSTNPYLGSI